MLDDDVGKAEMFRQVRRELTQGFEAAGGSADADYERAFVRLVLADRRVGGSGTRRFGFPWRCPFLLGRFQIASRGFGRFLPIWPGLAAQRIETVAAPAGSAESAGRQAWQAYSCRQP